MKETFVFLEKKGIYFLLLSFLVATILHGRIFTLEIQGNHAWRQTQTMWNVRNFVRHDANILNPRGPSFNGGQDNIIRFEFPLMQYNIAILQKVFGESVVVARIYLMLQCFVMILGFYFLVKLITGSNLTSAITASFLLFSPLIYFYGANPIPDNLALLGAIWYLYYSFRYEKSKKITDAFLGGIFLLIATLAKLPFLLFSIVSIYFFFYNLIKSRAIKSILPGLLQLSLLTPAILWYAWVMPGWSDDYVTKGLFSESAANANVWEILDYHRRIMFPDKILYLPVWMSFIVGVWALFKIKKHHAFAILILLLMTSVYFLYEISFIGTVHDYYMIPFVVPLFLIASLGVKLCIESRILLIKYLPIAFLIFSPFYAFHHYNKLWYYPIDYFNQDVYKNREVLKDLAPNDALSIILNDHSGYIFAYNIDKMGHIFNKDLQIEWIGDMIDNYGVEYMYSDSKKINEDPKLAEFVDSTVFHDGSVMVFKLRESKNDTIKFLPFFKK